MKTLSDLAERFCRKHPNFGIPNLMVGVIIGQVIVFFMDMVSSSTFSGMLTFYRSAIFQGQVWRLISFVFVPESSGVIFMLFNVLFYLFLGRTLENQWGTGKFTFYYLTAVLVNIVFGLLTGYVSMYYMNMSLFFVVAATYPDLQFLFWFIPVKAKWLAWIDLAYFVADFIVMSFPYKLMPLLALVYFVLFFGDEAAGLLPDFLRNKIPQRRRKAYNTVSFRKEKHRIQKDRGYLHKCEVCGRTDTDFPDLEFRYCSKCEGYHCYCMDHINNHQHVQ